MRLPTRLVLKISPIIYLENQSIIYRDSSQHFESGQLQRQHE